MKVVYEENEYGRCVLEFWQGRVFLHLSMKRWDTNVYRYLLRELPTLRTCVYVPLEAYFPTADPRIESMARLFGFSVVKRNDDLVLVKEQAHA